MGRFMASSKNLFQGILNKGLRVGFSRIPRGVLSMAVEHPLCKALLKLSLMFPRCQIWARFVIFTLCSERTERQKQEHPRPYFYQYPI